MSLIIDTLGGLCPVQGEGTIDGVPFYFRARWDGWDIGVGDDPVGIAMCCVEGWHRDGQWGDSPYGAGYMPLSVAQDIIERCAKEYQNERMKKAVLLRSCE